MCVTLLAGYQREPTMSQSDANRGDILIVDDTLPNLRYLQALLTTRGYDVRGAPSGQMALMVARNAPPDLILLDIKMPDLDGYDVCRQLKADTQTCDIPIIFISAMDAVLDKVKAFEAGGVDYITKPFQVDEIIARIENHLTIRVLQRQLQQANDELSLTNAELRQANQSLQASNEELDAFSRTMAYDLKNPFAAIIGYAELLGETFHDDPSPMAERLELIEQIMRSGRQGVRIVDALLMLARVRRDAVETGPIDMTMVFHDVRRRLDPMIRQYQAELILPDAWPLAIGYSPWIEEVWINYVSNGIKYGGQPPRVEVGATPLADGAIRFWAGDNGPGVAVDAQDKLFTHFTRLEKVGQSQGLGLAIVRRIVEKLGGEVGVERKEGQGSLFYFTLPAFRVDS